jgi:hypothetical protein
VRYEPAAAISHQEPTTVRGMLVRRFRYGTAGARLARRHPDYFVTWVIHPRPPLRNTRGLARYASTYLPLPVVIAALRTRRRGLRAGLLMLLLAPALEDWRERSSDLDPLRWTALWLADDAAYGAGVWTGCLRAGSLRALTPRLSTRRWRKRLAELLPGHAPARTE